MTTAARFNQVIGGVYVYAPVVIKALNEYGIKVLAEGDITINLTGYAPGLTITIVCQDRDELLQLETDFCLAVQETLYKLDQTDTES